MEYGKRRERHMRNIVRIVIYALLVALFIVALALLGNRDRTRELETLTNAVEEDVSAFYARNGYYPDTVEVLQNEYGLTYDKDRYYIGYDLRGANIRPYIKVVELGK